MPFERDLGGGITLALRTPEMARKVRDVAAANIERLRQRAAASEMCSIFGLLWDFDPKLLLFSERSAQPA